MKTQEVKRLIFEVMTAGKGPKLRVRHIMSSREGSLCGVNSTDLKVRVRWDDGMRDTKHGLEKLDMLFLDSDR